MPGGRDSRGHRDGHLERSHRLPQMPGSMCKKDCLYLGREFNVMQGEVGKGAEGSPQRSAATFEVTVSTSSVGQLLHHVILEV